MKSLRVKDLVHEGVEELEKIAPKDSHVEIDVIEDPPGHFSTHILLKTKFKTYFARKDATFIWESFHKAMKAVKTQMRKRKIKHETIRAQ